MTTDVAYILTKARHTFRALRSQLVADRAPEDPHRFVRMTLQIVVEGAVAADAVERAIALSRDKYCSVWHSMRQDIEFTASGRVEP
jgi:putative redox protein